MKLLLARKYISKNPFTRYMQKNIIERWIPYHEDFVKMAKVAEQLKKDDYSVRIVEIPEQEWIESFNRDING